MPVRTSSGSCWSSSRTSTPASTALIWTVTAGSDTRYLDHYCTDHDRHPYLITAGSRIAGMALVRQGPPHSMAEFLVMPRYRRGGVGRFAAQRLFASLPGPWQVRQVAGNAAAVAFWRAVIPCPFADEQDEHGATQLFTMPAG